MNLEHIEVNSLVGLLEILQDRKIHDLEYVKRVFQERFVFFHETVNFLKYFGLVRIEKNELIAVVSTIPPKKRIIQLISKIRKDIPSLDKFINFFAFSEKGYTFIPTSNQIVRFFNERKFLKDLDVLQMEDGRLFIVNTDIIAEHIRKALDQERLLKLIDNETLVGERAELIVLENEKKIVSQKFPTLPSNQVVQVSIDNVELGYDILSIEHENQNANPIELKYIEVKAISKNSTEFMWSKNEINAAKRYGCHYYLYLVPDPLRLVNPDEIMIIRDAYSNVYESTEWEREEQKILFVKTKGNG